VDDFTLLAFIRTTPPPPPPEPDQPFNQAAFTVAGVLKVKSPLHSIINNHPPLPPAEEVPETNAPPPAQQYQE